MLDSQSPAFHHILQNLALIVLSLIVLPLSSAFLLFLYIVRIFRTDQIFNHRHAIRQTEEFRAKTFLVTGVGMTKGLAVARLLFEAGHSVIGADFESDGALVCGRFSKALESFYSLREPNSEDGSSNYIDTLLYIIEKEGVDIWVSCSSVTSAIEDSLAKEVIERKTMCRAIQFDTEATETLHKKHTFIENTRRMGLKVPETHEITDPDEALEFLNNVTGDKKFILKPIGVNDTARGNMTLLPRSTNEQTRQHLACVKIDKLNPWILQQYLSGSEYCTHSLIVRGRVKAFVTCPSAELLMHYTALPADSGVTQAALRFTEEYAAKSGKDFSGHLSFDFMTEDQYSRDRSATKLTLYPIECNPRAHTAVALFCENKEMASAYLSLLKEYPDEKVIFPRGGSKVYWIGHDLITIVVLPLCSLLTLNSSLVEFFKSIRTFMVHVLLWKDGTLEYWDPLPWWWLYHVYWPMRFLACIRTGQKWSRVNVSTTKMFRC